MTQEKLKQFLDACFDAKRLIEKLPDLPDGMKPRQVHVLDAVNEIQKKQGSQWITVDSWSVEKDGRNANLSKSVEAKKGTTYRAKVKVTVWLDGKSESKTITTSGKTA
mgnify:CR=1 FL=1